MNRVKIPKFSGLNKSISPRDLPPDMLQDCKNIIFDDGKVKTRWGYTAVGSNTPLDGAVTCVAEYKQLRGDSTTKIALTERQGYEYEGSGFAATQHDSL